jgi:hypothetical protein
LPSGIGGAVVHHDDFMRDAAEGKFKVEVLNGRGDAALLVPRRNDDRKERKQAGFFQLGITGEHE